MSRSSTGPGPRILVDFLFLGAVFVGGLFVIYKAVSMVVGGVDGPELAVGMNAPLDGFAQEPPKGLTIRLSEGAPREAPETPTPVTEPLSQDEVRQVLARVPALPEDPGAESDFALSPDLVPPPRRGVTVQAEFPPAHERERREEVVSGPLEVVRHAPEGEVERARELSITFSQPMVPVTSHEELAARDVPARLRPQVEGRWRWVGTRTLLFEVDAGFPMATEYQALVPAGVSSAIGARLTEPLAWTFKTPPPSVTESLPHGDAITDSPLMFVAFDQRIDAGAVLDHITVRAAGRTFKVRRADREEIAEDERVEQATKSTPEGRWVAFRAVRPLPRDSRVDVVIEPGTPSAEGPIRTDTAQTFSFRTYGPLRVERSWCSGPGRECRPGSTWQITFSNPIDSETFDESLIRVEPELPLLRYRLSNDQLAINGRMEPRRDYRVTLSVDVRDVFGQALGQETDIRFEVGPAIAALTARAERLVVLDPLAPREFVVKSVNVPALRIRIYRVRPQDWPAFEEAYRRNRRSEDPWDPPGLLVSERSIPVDAEPDALAETRIDLEPTLSNGLGHVVVAVEPTEWPDDLRRRPSVYVWVQATRISISALADPLEVTGWVTALEGAAPLAGATLDLVPSGARATTDAEGLAVLPLPTDRSRDGRAALVARLGDDVALLPIQFWTRIPRDAMGWYVFTDRPLYRPGEEVHVKGWLRRIGAGESGDVQLPINSISQVSYTVLGSQGNELAEGRAGLNDLAGFDAEFRLPEEMNLGPVSIRMEALGAPRDLDARNHVHYFQVEEFRRPEYEVSVSHDAGPHIVGGAAIFTVAASYFAGGGLPNSEVTWRVQPRRTRFYPPNWDDFSFGYPQAIGGDAEHYSAHTDLDGEHHLRVDLLDVDPPVPVGLRATATVLDVNRQAWTESTDVVVHPAALSVGLRTPRRFVRAGEPLVVEAIVVDLDGEAVVGRTVNVEATHWTWELVDGEWRSEESESQHCRIESTAGPGRCEFETPAGGVYRVSASVEDDEGRISLSELRPWVGGGFYFRGRSGEEEVELVADRDEYQPGDTAEILVQAPFFPAEGVMTLSRAGIVAVERFRTQGPSQVLRVPIVEAYIPNLYVHVDLVAATDGAAGVVDPDQHEENHIRLLVPPRSRTLALSAVPRAKELRPGEETVVDIELRDASDRPVPDGDVVVAVVDEAVLALLPEELQNPVETFHPQRTADVIGYHLRSSVLLGPRPDPEAGRRDSGAIEGTVTETEYGDPVGGVRVSLEGTSYAARTGADGTYSIENVTPGRYTAVAELPGYETIYRRVVVSADRSTLTNFGLSLYDLLAGLEFRMDPVSVSAARAPEGMAAEAPAEVAGIRLRSDFAALAAFVGSARTDANGQVEIPVRVPDNLTRYRVIALAAAGAKQFGKGESTITVGLPLMARPSAPRFLNFGDRIEFPVVVQNRTDEALQVDVAVRATNLEWIEGQGRRVEVPAQGRVEVRFPVTTHSAGTARVQVAAAAGEQADAAMIQLPVWTPATTEAFATYGDLDSRAAAIPVAAPGDVFEGYGGLEVTTSSTALQALTDALLYLHSYPFECAEQISSRILAVAALRDVLTAFEAEGLPEPEALVAAVERDIKKLAELQNNDGGFSFWGGRDESWPYVSIHAAHAIERARQKGFQVPGGLRENVSRYLREIERRIPNWYSESVRRTLIAYTLYVRQLMGDSDPAAAERLIAEAGLENLPLEATGWLLAVLSREREYSREISSIRRHLDNRASETAATAQFTSGYGDGDYLVLHSGRRTDAVILEALIIDQPRNDLIPKLVRGLLGHRRRGRWLNTQENVFVLLALDRYFNTFERVTPDFAARIWLGEDYAGGHEFRGRTTERYQIDVPMEWLAERTGTQNLIVGRQGRGRLYYRVGLRYAPADLMLDPAEHGFSVERVYEAVDDPEDVRREEDGTWVIRAGARVKVLLTMAAPARRYHVALVDPLPAGLEALNPELAGADTYEPRAERAEPLAPGLEPYRGFYWYRWYEHENLRDERVEVFTSLLYGGVRTYSYLARATTPGTFVVPPPKAEEMYHPETFGRGASDRVVVR